MSQSIFICYRRTDSGWAGRLQHELDERFGDAAVFRDRSIPAGVSWRTHIESVLDTCEVMLVMIGPSWTQLTGRDGVARIWEADDVVRQEIERGVQRTDVLVIPILFDDAKMPAREQLPPGLQSLCDLQAVALDDARWDYDIEQLGNQLATIVPELKGSDTHVRVTGRAILAMTGAAAGASLLAAPLATTKTWGQVSHAGTIADRLNAGWIADALARVGGIALHMAFLWGIVGALTFAALYLALRETRVGVPAGVAVGVASGALAGAAGAIVYVVLKDLLVLDVSEPLLNGAAVAAAGIVFAGRIAALAGGVDRSVYLTVGAVGGLCAGLLGGVLDDANMNSVGWAVQAVVLIGALASLFAMPTLSVSPAPMLAR